MPCDYSTPAADATDWDRALNETFGAIDGDVRALAERVAALEGERERERDAGGTVHYGGGWPARLDDEHGWARPDRTTHAEVGGGRGYGRRIAEPPAGAVVAADRREFLDALDAVPEGGTIWVPGSATIDLSGLQDLDVPRGVTLASDRGVDGSDGGLLQAPAMPQNGEPNDYGVTFLFRITSDDVRVTGLRIRGPRHRSEGPVMRVEDPPLREDGEPTDEMYDDETTIPTKKDGIVFDGGARAELDNCEVSGIPQMWETQGRRRLRPSLPRPPHEPDGLRLRRHPGACSNTRRVPSLRPLPPRDRQRRHLLVGRRGPLQRDGAEPAEPPDRRPRRHP
jgi:hypothetical protein